MIDAYQPADVGGLFADLGARIEVSIGNLGKELSKPRKPKPPAQPVFGRVRGTVTVGSSGVAIITFDQPGPVEGRFWYIRNLVIGGLSPTTTAAGRADVFVTAQLPNQTLTLAQMGLSDWRDQAASLPDVSFYGRGELPLRHNENLVIILSNATNAQQYVAAASFEEYQESAAVQAWDM